MSVADNPATDEGVVIEHASASAEDDAALDKLGVGAESTSSVLISASVPSLYAAYTK